MSLTDIMTTRVVTVLMDDTLNTIRHIFQRTQFHHLIVLESRKVVGVISDRDVLKATSPFLDTLSERPLDKQVLGKKAHQIMTRNVISLTPSHSIFNAITSFNRHSISCIPIVNNENEIKGIITWRDIMRYVEDKVENKKR